MRFIGGLGVGMSSIVVPAYLSEIAPARSRGRLVVFFLFLFIASHAVGQGAVIWVFIAEIFPNKVRTRGQSLGSGTHWTFAALITLAMPRVLRHFEAYSVFGFFAAMMVLQLLFVLLVMPETRGRSLESLAEHLSRHDHPSFDEPVVKP